MCHTHYVVPPTLVAAGRRLYKPSLSLMRAKSVMGVINFRILVVCVIAAACQVGGISMSGGLVK